MESFGGCAGERKHVFHDKARKIKSEAAEGTRVTAEKMSPACEIEVANPGKIDENVPVRYFTHLKHRMKLPYFIGGSATLLIAWLALTFVSTTPPASGSKSAKPGAAETEPKSEVKPVS